MKKVENQQKSRHIPEVINLTSENGKGKEAIGDVLGSPFLNLGVLDESEVTLGSHVLVH